ncbi:hypothetical protein Acr_20g0000520 [Actinidia rufa]|uniref:Uncharacterized protein n=1 Tax=Actinidia rufa TaxID=165716 RepID=A0A7J0GBS4_9ERIC|nr:hypothetical protein Acr_20g0000520 [Actinidia rufa]
MVDSVIGGGGSCKRRWRRSSPSSIAKASKMNGMGVVLNNLSVKSLKFWFQPHKKLIGMMTVKTASCYPPFSGELAEGAHTGQVPPIETVNKRNNLPQKGLRKPEKPGSVALGLVIVPKSHPDLPLPPRKRRTERDQAAKFFPFNSSQVIRAPGVCWDREKSGRGGGGRTTTFSTLLTSEPDMMAVASEAAAREEASRRACEEEPRGWRASRGGWGASRRWMGSLTKNTPSPIGRELLKEETPYSVAGNSFSLSKKIYSLGSGSWNIQEEIRRVRSNATEDMLKTTPSMKIDLSSFSLEPKSIHKSLLADKTDFGRGEKAHDLNYLMARKSIDASAELAAGVSPCHGIPALEMTVDGSQNEDLSSQPVISSAQNQDLVAIQIVEGEEHAAAQSHHPTIPDLALEHGVWRLPQRAHAVEFNWSRDPSAEGSLCGGDHSCRAMIMEGAHFVEGLIPCSAYSCGGSSICGGITIEDSVLSERICSSAKEGIELRGDPNANGFPYSGLSLSAGHGDQNPRPSNDKNPSPISSNHKTLANSIPAEETCELLSEASMEVPVVNETNSIAGDSQNSSSMQCEELLQEMTQLNPPVHRLTGKTTNMADKQQGRKMTRHNRKKQGEGIAQSGSIDLMKPSDISPTFDHHRSLLLPLMFSQQERRDVVVGGGEEGLGLCDGGAGIRGRWHRWGL